MMFNLHFVILLTAAFHSLSVNALENTIHNLHGSGTTNPNFCYWNILDKLSAQSKMPLKLTYRGVGSSTGQQEIINNNTKDSAPVYFSSADLPFSTSQYTNLSAAGVQILQLPVLLGTVSIFHSAALKLKEEDSTTAPQLKLSPCVLARIYMNEITSWDDPSILELNPDIIIDAEPITVMVRDTGGSTTWAFSNYLNLACYGDFPEDMTGSTPSWSDSFQRCQGNAGMVDAVLATPGAIAYIESGHGNSAGLSEVLVSNAAGNYLTSTQAAERGGILSAQVEAFPPSAESDFGDVNLLYQQGTDTWPMVIMTYIFVRTNLVYIEDPIEQAVLVAFLRMLQNEDYVGVCRDQYGFDLPGTDASQLTKNGIDLLEGSIKENLRLQGQTYIPFTFESTAQPITGMGDYVVSKSRSTITQVVTSDLTTRIAELEDLLQQSAIAAEAAKAEFAEYIATKNQQFQTAVILSSIALAISVLSTLLVATHLFLKMKHNSYVATDKAEKEEKDGDDV